MKINCLPIFNSSLPQLSKCFISNLTLQQKKIYFVATAILTTIVGACYFFYHFYKNKQIKPIIPNDPPKKNPEFKDVTNKKTEINLPDGSNVGELNRKIPNEQRESFFMNPNDATLSFVTTETAACSQFMIHHEGVVQMTLSGPSRYTHLKLDDVQSQTVNALAKEVGINHESGPNRNTFMVYSATFHPGQVTGSRHSCKATSEEKRVFGEIFETAAASIAVQMGWSVSPGDVMRIVLNKTVDFSFIEASRACRLDIELTQSAADRLGMDKDSRFREYGKGPSKKNPDLKDENKKTEIILLDGSKYVGELNGNIPNGQGKKTYQNDTVEEGLFKNGKLNGKGMIRRPRYELDKFYEIFEGNDDLCEVIEKGNFEDGKLEGEGSLIYYWGPAIMLGFEGKFHQGKFVEGKKINVRD